jgi:hypothetical protein
MTASPPASHAGGSQSHAGAAAPPLRVVTRLALEGKATHGKEGASMRMYLKVCAPRFRKRRRG